MKPLLLIFLQLIFFLLTDAAVTKLKLKKTESLRQRLSRTGRWREKLQKLREQRLKSGKPRSFATYREGVSDSCSASDSWLKLLIRRTKNSRSLT